MSNKFGVTATAVEQSISRGVSTQIILSGLATRIGQDVTYLSGAEAKSYARRLALFLDNVMVDINADR